MITISPSYYIWESLTQDCVSDEKSVQ